MGFLSYLKKIVSEQKENEEVSIAKTETKLSLEEIKARISSEQKQLLEKNEELRQKAKSVVQENISQLKNCLDSLKTANLDKRREDPKLKAIVLENVVIYSSYLEKFITDLEKFEDINKIDSIFENFYKNSNKSHQKATILIGKEFEEIKNVLKKMASDLHIYLKENKENIDKINKFKEAEGKLKEIAEISRTEKEIKENILKLKDTKKGKEEELIKNKKNSQEIIKSQDYIKENEKKEQIIVKTKSLEDKLSKIFARINLKELAKIYHENEKKYLLIRSYIENYKKAIEEDKERNFEKIVKEYLGEDINLVEITDKIAELKNYSFPNEIKLNQIGESINSLEIQIKRIEEDIAEEEKKIVRFESKLQEVEEKLRSQI